MKPFIIIIVVLTVLLGVILITNRPKETLINNSNITESANVENTENCEGENCEINDSDDEHSDEEHEHDHSVEIEGSEMKQLTIQEVADLWEIDSEELLDKIILEFNLEGDYSTKTTLEYIRDEEYKFSPAIIKDLAEEIKN